MSDKLDQISKELGDIADRLNNLSFRINNAQQEQAECVNPELFTNQDDERPSAETLGGETSPRSSGKQASIASLLEQLETVLETYNINADIVGFTRGTNVSQFKLKLHSEEHISNLKRRKEDLELVLGRGNIRLITFRNDNTTVGLEVPNSERSTITLRTCFRELVTELESTVIPVVFGLTVEGEILYDDLAQQIHLLVSGMAGSGESMFLKNIITTQLLFQRPEDLQLILVNLKHGEFSLFRNVPHLISPVLTESNRVLKRFDWLEKEMEERYQLFKHTDCRSIDEYRNLSEEQAKRRLKDNGKDPEKYYKENTPRILMVVDELTDLMFTSSSEVEGAITRIAMKARAVGIHMILATQRPSNNVITGMIKSNMPARISFKVMPKMDSRIILDQKGGENLTGNGDMLVQLSDRRALFRVQGPIVGGEEMKNISEFWRNQQQLREV